MMLVFMATITWTWWINRQGTLYWNLDPHPFWDIRCSPEKRNRTVHILKNVSIVGALTILQQLANHHSPRHQPAQVLTWIVGLGQKELSAPSLCHLPPAPRDPKKQLSPYNSKTLNQNRGTYGRIQISYWRPKPPACRISCTSVIARPR